MNENTSGSGSPGGFFEVTGKPEELERILDGIRFNEGRLTADSSFTLDLWLEMKDEWFRIHDEAVRVDERERVVSALIGPEANLAASVRAFKAGWHDADLRGLVGERVASGLRHVVDTRIREQGKGQS